jgi:serine/threonine protein kinase
MMLCGEQPFEHPNMGKLIHYITMGEYSFSSPIWFKISTYAKDLISRMLATDPALRFNSSSVLSHPWFD